MEFFIETQWHGKVKVQQSIRDNNSFTLHFENGSTYDIEKTAKGWKNIGKVSKFNSGPDIDLEIPEIGQLIELAISK